MKRGISLIAVLMFMLAATTASVVLYRWIGSENFASGSRLKQSEAYQASESGLDAVQAWLSYKAADVGGVLGDYLSIQSETVVQNKTHYHLNSANNNVLANFSNSKQDFKVYLIGADIKKNPYKLKFMSVGTGRDGSKVSQTAIFSVEGLYRTDIPVLMNVPERPPPQKTQYNEDFWGNMGTAHSIQSMSMVMTQTADMKNAGGMGLNKITIGNGIDDPGYLVLDGNYYTNNGIKIYGDAYVTGNYDLCASGSDEITGDLYIGGVFHPRVVGGQTFNIKGSAYFGDTINPNANNPSGGCSGALGGKVKIEGNSTMMGPYRYLLDNSGLDFDIDKSLVMGSNSYINLSDVNVNNTKPYFEVGENVALINFNNPDVPTPNLNNSAGNPHPSNSNLWPKLGKLISSELCLKPTVEKMNNDFYKDALGFYFQTSANESKVKSDCTPTSYWGADPLDGTYPPDAAQENRKNLLAKLQEGSSTRSCDNTPIKFNMNIYDDVINPNPPNWVHSANKPENCAVQNGKLKLDNEWVNLNEELKKCWIAAKNNGKLYSSGGKDWLVVHLKNQRYTITTGKNEDLLCEQSYGVDKCRYIIIFDFLPPGGNDYLYLPPTGTQAKNNAEVMIYLPQGAPYMVGLDGGTASANAEMGDNGARFIDGLYNYFIFSDGNIKQFNTTGNRRLTGNVFMNKCSIMNDGTAQGNPYFISRGNTDFVEELTTQGILLENDWTIEPPPPPPPGQTNYKIEEKKDGYIIPLSPRLKVELESKNISKESDPQLSSLDYAKKSVLVMPRVLRMPPNALSASISLDKYYKFLYLNGATEQNKPLTSPDCKKTDDPSISLNETTPEEGIYTCTFTRNGTNDVSKLYVKIQNSAPLPEQPLPEPGISSPAQISSSSAAESPSSSSEGSNLPPSSSSSTPSSNSTPGSNCSYPTEWCNPTTTNLPNPDAFSFNSIPPNSTRPNNLITNTSYYIIGENLEHHSERCIFTTNIQNLGNHGIECDKYTGNANDFVCSDGTLACRTGQDCGSKSRRYENYYPIRVNGIVLKQTYDNKHSDATTYGEWGGGRCGGNGQSWQSNLFSCDEALSKTGIGRVNGGYYVYLPPGWISQNIQLAGGVPVCPPMPSCNGVYLPHGTVPPQQDRNKCVKRGDKCYMCNGQDNPPNCTYEWFWNSWNNNWLGEGWLDEYSCGGSSSSSSVTPSSSSSACVGESEGCSGTSSSSSVTSTATCSFSSASAYVGQNIGSPTITCTPTSTSDLSNAIFSGDVPSNWTEWKSNSNAHYSGSTTPGSKSISVSDITCGGNEVSGSINCGSITVSKPTCSVASSTNSGSAYIITPKINCGGTVTNIDFGFSESACSWNTTIGSTNGYFTRTATGDCTLTLNKLKCGDNSITSIDESCGSINVCVGTDCPLIFNQTEEITLEAGKTYSIVCSSNKGVHCLTSSSTNWTYKINGGAPQAGNINNNVTTVISSCTNNTTIETTMNINCKNRTGWYND